jgi:hypothetical protein
MRVTASVPGFEAWIDFTDVWSRADLRRVMDLDGQEFLDFLAAKAETCYIEAVDGNPITMSADLSIAENYDRLDLRVTQFLAQAIITAAGEAMAGARNGFFCVPSSAPSATSQETTPQPTTQ